MAFDALPAAFPKLQRLQLGVAVTDADMAELWRLRAVLPSLKHLVLGGCHAVTNTGLHHVMPLTALTSLDLEATAVDDAGLACLFWLPGLQELYLGGTGIMAAGVARVLRLPALHMLDILGCEQLTDAQLLALVCGASEVGKAAGAAALAERANDKDVAWCTATADACMPSVLPLLSHSSRNMVESGVALLSNLSSDNAHVCNAVLAAGRLPHLVALLDSQFCVDTKVHVAVMLADIAELGSTQRAAIVAAGAVPPLVALMSHRKAAAAVAEAAVLAVFNLSKDSPGDGAVVAAGCIPPLIALLGHDSADVACGAAYAISRIAADDGADKQQYRQQLVAEGAFPALSRLLNNSDDRCVAAAITALSILGHHT